jgi:short-subunit dehydrogenase
MMSWIFGLLALAVGIANIAWKRALPLPLPFLLRPWVAAVLSVFAGACWVGGSEGYSVDPSQVAHISAGSKQQIAVLALALAGLALACVAFASPSSAAQRRPKKMDFRGRWVLVTGASAGLGREFARQLARDHGANLILLARRKERLDELQAELEPCGVQVRSLVADLSKPADVEQVLGEILAGPPVYGVVLNAAVTYFGPQEKLDPRTFQTLLDTNVASVVRFASVLVPDILNRAASGGVLFVSSVAGLQPAPYQSVYSGSKAFMNHFAFGLWHELRGQDISVTTFAPGGIDTEMTALESFQPLAAWLMPAATAARLGLRAFQRRDYLYVPGFVNQLGALLTRILPRRFVTALIARAYRRALEATTH